MYVEIIPSKACNMETLTYSVPKKFQEHIKVGSLVRIPFRTGYMHGLALKITTNKPHFKTRPITEVSEIKIHQKNVELIQWINQYYFVSLHTAAKLFLPSKIWNHEFKLPKTIWYTLKESARKDLKETLKNLTRSKKQHELVELLEVKDRTEEKIIEKGFSKQIIKSLIEKNYIEQYEESHLTEEHSKKNPTKKEHDDEKLNHRKCNFTPQQKKVFDDIQKSTQPLHLLHGVTGSGKTEVYLHLIHEQLEKGHQSLILLPEISLTPQTQKYFENTFGSATVSVIHSGQTPKERRESWLNVYTGKTKIIIGARSALFAPFKNLGIIVIDESHDQSFKQDTLPRYNAKRIAAELARLHNIQVIYGSATPNVETYYVAQKSTAIELNHIDEKIAKNSKRDIYMVDMKQEWQKKNFSIFSELLIEKIQEKLEKKEQIILFVNRRGMASSMICRDCGYKDSCQSCGIPLTYHKATPYNQTPSLQCHHCGFKKQPEINCPTCKGHNFKLTGVGTEKVETEIQAHFPDARVIRADRDTTSKTGAIKEIYNTFKNGKADILIGTQMIAKGWDVPNVTLVGIVLADIGINIPDFRSSERIFQLLTQVAGRTARGDKHGEVIIQTYNPDNRTIQAAAQDDYHIFYEGEIADRKKFNFPPFSKIIKMTVTDENLEKCIAKAQKLSEYLKKISSATQIYLAPDFISYKGGKHHYNVFLQGTHPDKILYKTPPAKLREVKIDRV